MKVLLPALLLTAIVTHATVAEEPIRERIEWMDVRITDADKQALPRVLFVGDSITGGYYDGVEWMLEGKAYCARLTTSKCVADPSFITDVQSLLKQYRFSIIHFNNGLHGWGYSEAEYAQGLQQTMAAIQAQAGDAKLIWGTTTPVRDKRDLQRFDEQTPRVKTRNELASAIMNERGIATNDLFQLVVEHPEWQSSDGVHFNGEGSKALAEHVAASVRELLPSPTGLDQGK